MNLCDTEGKFLGISSIALTRTVAMTRIVANTPNALRIDNSFRDLKRMKGIVTRIEHDTIL